jgi:hypothetical protein
MKDEALRMAMRKAFNLGSIYWQQVDSEFSSNWKKGDATKAQLDQLIEDTIKRAIAESALDKKAENARELGLDYEPADGTQVSKVWWDGEKLMAKPIPLEDIYQPAPVQEPVAKYIGECSEGSLVQLYEDVKKGTEFYTTPPAQPAPAQPVARTDQQIVDQTEELAVWLLSWCFNHQPETDTPMRESTHPFAERCWAAACHIQEMLTATDPENSVAELDAETTKPAAQQHGPYSAPVKEMWPVAPKAAAQPAVPDAIHHTDLSESLEYIQGWNDCRAEMLKEMKP